MQNEPLYSARNHYWSKHGGDCWTTPRLNIGMDTGLGHRQKPLLWHNIQSSIYFTSTMFLFFQYCELSLWFHCGCSGLPVGVQAVMHSWNLSLRPIFIRLKKNKNTLISILVSAPKIPTSDGLLVRWGHGEVWGWWSVVQPGWVTLPAAGNMLSGDLVTALLKCFLATQC